jgi:hypothetical protein
MLNRKFELLEFYEHNDINQVNQIVESFKVLFKKFLFFTTQEEVANFLKTFEISKEEKKLIFQIFQTRKEELQSFFQNSNISSCFLSNFDWKLQVLIFFVKIERLLFQVTNIQILKNQFCC